MTSPHFPFEHRILLVEDDDVSLFAASSVLAHLTNMVDMARDVEDAKDRLDDMAYDLVIADVNLPDGTGRDIIQYAHTSADSKNKTTPFVALTAHQDDKKHQQIRSDGFNEVVVKPLSLGRAYLFLEQFPTYKEGGVRPADLAVIDLALGMKRIGADNDEKALIAIGMLIESLKEDIMQLKQLHATRDIDGIYEILHKMKGGLDYSGALRLEKQVDRLNAAIREDNHLTGLEALFDAVYEQVTILKTTYQAMLKDRRGE